MYYKKTFLLGASALFVLILCAGGLYGRHLNNNYKLVTNRCIGYKPEWIGMSDCFGIISIWKPDNSGFLVMNNKEPGPIIAQIQSANAFVIKNEEMFFIDITPSDKCNNLVPGKYCGTFQINGQTMTNYYDDANQVPKFIVVNTKTGDERFYSKLEEMSENDRKVFQQLSSK